MKLKPALATLVIGLALYFGLPHLAAVPPSFKGTLAPSSVAASTAEAPAAAGTVSQPESAGKAMTEVTK